MKIILEVKKILKEKIKLLYEKGGLHIFFGTIMTKFVAFFGSMFIVRLLSKTEYGVLSYIENIYGFVYILAGLGLGNALVRYVILSRDIEEKYSIYCYTIIRGFVYNIVILIVGLILNLIIEHPSEFLIAKNLIPIFLLALPFQYIVDCELLNERAMFNNKRFAVYSFFTSALLIFGKIIGAYVYNLQGLIIIFLVTYLIWSIVLLILTKKNYYKNVIRTKLKNVEQREINKYSFQYMVTNGIWVLFMLLDVFLLGRIGDPVTVANYKVAYVLPGALSIISSSIGVFVAPYFVRHENDNVWIRANFKKVYFINAILIGICALVLIVFAKPILLLLYGEMYLDIANLMRLLTIVAFINAGLRFTSANLLSAMGEVKYNMAFSIAGILTQFSVNLFVIPKFGAYGAAFTNIGVYAFMAIGLLITFIYKYYIKHQSNKPKA